MREINAKKEIQEQFTEVEFTEDKYRQNFVELIFDNFLKFDFVRTRMFIETWKLAFFTNIQKYCRFPKLKNSYAPVPILSSSNIIKLEKQRRNAPTVHDGSQFRE